MLGGEGQVGLMHIGHKQLYSCHLFYLEDIILSLRIRVLAVHMQYSARPIGTIHL